MRKTGHADNSGEKKRRGEDSVGVEVVAGVKEVGSCSVDHILCPQQRRPTC